MSAVGASLAMEELNGGILVDKIVMYGLIGRVNNSRQIRLDMDFVVGKSRFMKCRKEFNFDLLINIILDSL